MLKEIQENDMKVWKIGILVENLETAENLYANVLGLKVTSRNPRAVYLDAGGVTLELIRKEVFEGDKRLGVPGIHHISFKVDDIEKESEKLKKEGVEFIREPFEITKGLKLAFFDGLNNVNLQFFDDKR
jgi:catechol 2,3-dioxygenase-like lactoylglutathione lyase family enzyme